MHCVLILSSTEGCAEKGGPAFENRVMKLSRNMHTASRGAPNPVNPTDAQDINDQQQSTDCLSDAHPLLADEVNNDIVTEFFSSTLQARPTVLSNGYSPLNLPPHRSITSPQHPTRDLLETLNMHQHHGQLMAAARRKQKRHQEALARNAEKVKASNPPDQLIQMHTHAQCGLSMANMALMPTSSSASSSPSLSSSSSSSSSSTSSQQQQ